MPEFHCRTCKGKYWYYGELDECKMCEHKRENEKKLKRVEVKNDY